MQHFGLPDLGMLDLWSQGSISPTMDGADMEFGLAHSASFGTPINQCQQIVSDAIDTAPNLHGKVQELNLRVQKLERTRGQISKDVADMISEMRDLTKQAGLEPSAAIRRAAAASYQPRHHAMEAPAMLEDLGGETVLPARKSARAKTLPAFSLAAVPEEQTPAGTPPAVQVSKSKTEVFLPPPGLQTPLPESLAVINKEVDGVEIPHVEWRIDNVRGKLRECVGRPCVSPTFSAGGLPELRLMVEPKLGTEIGGLTMREQKAKYEARLVDGPLSGAIKFKVISTPEHCEKLLIKFNVFIGNFMQGPMEHDFAEHIIHSVDFSNNWLEQFKSGALTVGVELLSIDKEERGG